MYATSWIWEGVPEGLGLSYPTWSALGSQHGLDARLGATGNKYQVLELVTAPRRLPSSRQTQGEQELGDPEKKHG